MSQPTQRVGHRSSVSPSRARRRTRLPLSPPSPARGTDKAALSPAEVRGPAKAHRPYGSTGPYGSYGSTGPHGLATRSSAGPATGLPTP